MNNKSECTNLKEINLEWRSSVLLADGCDAITKGYIQVFGEPRVRLMCYFHVLHNLEKYFNVLPKQLRELKKDIGDLQTCPTQETFQKTTEWFFKKWNEPEVAALTTYFKNQWVKKNSLWFEGAAVGYPSSNNGLEATNGVIKRDHTLRTRLPVGQFLQSGSELLEKWSYARNPASVNCIPFAAVRSHSLAHWTAAYQWAGKNSKVLQVDDEGRTSLFYTMYFHVFWATNL